MQSLHQKIGSVSYFILSEIEKWPIPEKKNIFYGKSISQTYMYIYFIFNHLEEKWEIKLNYTCYKYKSNIETR